MTIVVFIVVFLVSTIISAACLWAGMKITKLDGPFVGLLITAGATSLVAFLPYVGLIGSFIVMCALLYKFTNADRIWPDVILMVIVARFVAIFAGMGIFSLVRSFAG